MANIKSEVEGIKVLVFIFIVTFMLGNNFFYFLYGPYYIFFFVVYCLLNLKSQLSLLGIGRQKSYPQKFKRKTTSDSWAGPPRYTAREYAIDLGIKF